MANVPKEKSNQTMKQRLFDIILNWSRNHKLKLPNVLYTILCQYYGKGDILIIFMDRLQIYNLISPNTININPPIQINQNTNNNNIYSANNNKFTFRCSVLNRCYDTNDILFIGGFNEKKGIAINECQLYSINDNKFYALSSCNDARSDSRSVMYNKYECIALGGHQIEAMNTVELYSFKKNKWEYLPNLPRKNVYFAAASAQHLGKIFIAGGQDSYGVHNNTYVLQKEEENIDNNNEWKWIELKNMKRYNYWCSGLYWDKYNEFLVIGGMRRDKNIDRYDVYKNEWYTLPKTQYDHHMGVCSIWNNYIVWIGDDRKMCNIELFDRRLNKWISRQIPNHLQPPYKKARIWKWI
eukprot:543277_1